MGRQFKYDNYVGKEESQLKKRIAIVLTDHYPYNTGEEFFEQEIDILCRAFERVFICPVRTEAGAVLTRPLPSNVRSFLLPPSSIPSWKLRAILKLPRILWGKEKMVETPLRDFLHWGMDVRFASIALDVRDRFVRTFPWEEIEDADEILIYSYWFFTGAAVGGMLKRNELQRKTVRVIARAHAYDVDEKDAPRGYIPSRRYVMEAVDRVYPISDYAAAFIRRRFPDQEHKIQTSRLGVPATREDKRIKPRNLHIVTCSHLAAYKRVWLTGEAVVELASRGHRVSWTHIGERNQQALDALKEDILRQAPSAELDFKGYMKNPQVREYYVTTPLTCFVNSSDGEGVPVSIMEAQATGLPVVATNAGGTAEIVSDKVNGRVIPVTTTPQELADAIEWVHALDEVEYQALCANARETWQEKSHADKQYVSFIESLGELFGDSSFPARTQLSEGS